MRFLPLLSSLLALAPGAVYAAFGVTQDNTYFTVDCGSSSSLVFKVRKSNGDITSILYRGVEFQHNSPYSHIGSGLGSASVSASTHGNVIKLTVSSGSITHYYVAKSGDSTIYMATHITQQPSIGELRFIARLKSSVVPGGPTEANTAGSSSTVEGSDVFIVNGQTRSKFYSSERFIDDKVHCVWGNAGRVCMVMPGTAYETSLGGPFMRDINSNNGGDYNALYWYMNSGHVATEPVRLGLKGPYAMVFTTGGTPSGDLDTSFFDNLNIMGYVPQSGRGRVSGTATGVDAGFQAVLHWKNSENQYWTYAASNGQYTSPYMKPGTYTMILYRDEFPIAEQSVTIRAGATTSSNIITTEKPRSTVWRIGDFNGQPKGFRNSDLQLRMHPSDSRMASWGPLTYSVGGTLNGFPMAQVKGMNEPTTILFNLQDTSGTFTLRIGTTLAFAGGRPSVEINSHSPRVPAAPTKIDSRGLTRGAYRGYGEVYDFPIPAGVLVNGANTVKIWVASGSSGAAFLAPNFTFDAVELFKEGGAITTTMQMPTSTVTSTTSTTMTSTSTTAIITPTGGAGGTVPIWGQCNGMNWTGGSCQAGLRCVYVNDWYSQCQQ